MDAIVYTSNSGFTKKYAILLGEKTGLPVYSLDEAKAKLEKGKRIIYLGWLMAGKIKGYKKALKMYDVYAVCGVGMGPTGSQLDDVKKANGISGILPVFTLQGGFDIGKVHGIYKLMMNFVKKASVKGVEEKKDITPQEKEMLEMFKNGADKVSEENLSEILSWYEEIK